MQQTPRREHGAVHLLQGTAATPSSPGSVPSSPRNPRMYQNATNRSKLEEINQLGSRAMHTPTVMLVELCQQLIGVRNLRAVGVSDSSQAQFGGRRDFKPIFMSVPENVTKRGSMFKCPTDWGLDRVDPPTFLWALVACEVLETAMCQQLITFISSVQSGADLSDSNAFLRVVVSSPVLSPESRTRPPSSLLDVHSIFWDTFVSVMTIIETELPGKGKIGLEYKKRLRLFLSTFFLQILKPQVASHAKHASVEEFYGQIRNLSQQIEALEETVELERQRRRPAEQRAEAAEAQLEQQLQNAKVEHGRSVDTLKSREHALQDKLELQKHEAAAAADDLRRLEREIALLKAEAAQFEAYKVAAAKTAEESSQKICRLATELESQQPRIEQAEAAARAADDRRKEAEQRHSEEQEGTRTELESERQKVSDLTAEVTVLERRCQSATAEQQATEVRLNNLVNELQAKLEAQEKHFSTRADELGQAMQERAADQVAVAVAEHKFQSYRLQAEGKEEALQKQLASMAAELEAVRRDRHDAEASSRAADDRAKAAVVQNEEDRSKYRAEIDAAKLKTAQIEKESRELKNDIGGLKSDNEALQMQNRDLNGLVAQRKLEVGRVGQDKIDAQNAVRAAEAKLTSVEAALQSERGVREEAEAGIELRNLQLQASQKRYKEAEIKYQADLEEERKKTAQQLQEVQALQALLNDAGHSHEATKAEKDTLEKRHGTTLDALRAQLENQKKTNSAMTIEIRSLKTTIAKLEVCKHTAEQERTAHEKELTALAAEVESERHRRGKTEAAAGSAEERLKLSERRYKEAESKLQNELDAARAEHVEDEHVIRELEAEIAKHKQSNESMQRHAESHSRMADQHRSESTKLAQTCTETHTAKRAAEAKLGELSEQLQSESQRRSDAEAEVALVQEKFRDLQRRVQDTKKSHKAELDDQLKKISERAEEVHALRALLAKGEHGHDTTKAEKEAAEKRHAAALEALRGQLAEQKKQLDGVLSELGEMQTESAKFEAYRSAVEGRHANSQKQLAALANERELERQLRAAAEATASAAESQLARMTETHEKRRKDVDQARETERQRMQSTVDTQQSWLTESKALIDGLRGELEGIASRLKFSPSPN